MCNCMQLFVMNLVKMKAHVMAQICVHVFLDGRTQLVTQVMEYAYVYCIVLLYCNIITVEE